jgi:outer membrane protein TolC
MRRLVYLLSLLLTTTLWAQKDWSLQECVAYAVENNLQLRDFELTAASNRETQRQAVRNLLPIINGFADYTVNFGRSINPEDNSFVNTEFFSSNFSLQSSLDLFQGFQKINNLKASSYLHKAAKEETTQQKYLLAFRVMSAYYDILFIEGLVTIAEEQVQISQDNYTLVTKQVDVGLMAKADLYEAESLLLTDQLSLTQNINRLQAAKLTLIQAMNLEGESDISLQSELMNEASTEESTRGSEDIYEEAKGFLPSVKAQEFRVKAAKKQLAAARGALFPSLSLNGGIGTGYFETIRDTSGITIPFRDQIRDNTFKFVGLSLNAPIFSGWANRSRIKQQKIALERAENNAKITEQELFQIIQQLVQERDALSVETAQTAKAVESQRVAFSVAQKRYEKGLINAIELGRAKNLYITAQNQELQARLRAQVNYSTLNFYKGLPTFNIN